MQKHDEHLHQMWLWWTQTVHDRLRMANIVRGGSEPSHRSARKACNNNFLARLEKTKPGMVSACGFVYYR